MSYILENNDWLVVNQYAIQGNQRNRRPDVVVFVNGLPLSVIEFKNPASLFGNKKIIYVSRPQDSLLQYIEKIENPETTVIINGEGFSTSSKLKKYFLLHKKYYCINCYKLTRGYKKKLIDKALNEKKIKFSEDAYWFLIDGISDEYQLLENEIEKISNFKNDKLSLDIANKLLSNKKNIQLDELFLHCLTGNNKSIIDLTKKSLLSAEEVYLFLQVVKNYSKILIKTCELKDTKPISQLVDQFLPRYLFKQKGVFEKIIKKTTISKIIDLNKLIQKTELFLRLNNTNHQIIVQRFLLNARKIVK